MSGRKLWMAVALALVAPPAFAARPEAREGGGGSGAVAAGSRHQASGSSSAVPRGGAPGVTGPQARHPRAGTGTGGYGYYGRRYGYGYGGYPYYRPYYGSRFYRPGFYSGFYWGYPYYYGGYYGGGYYAPAYGAPYYRDAGSLRLIVKPEETRVYVDGYYAGIVDDFDGIFQRLNLPPGRHEVTLKLDGFRTHGFRVYVPVDQTLKIHYQMAQGAGEDATDEIVGTPPENEREDQDRYTRRDDHAAEGPYAGDDRREYPGDGDDRDYRGEDNRYGNDQERDDRYENDRAYDQGRDQGADDQDAGIQDDRSAAGDEGTLQLDVRPEDASVYVDGAFQGTARDLPDVSLEPGRHRVEVVRPGFRTVERDVEIEAGGSQRLGVELEH